MTAFDGVVGAWPPSRLNGAQSPLGRGRLGFEDSRCGGASQGPYVLAACPSAPFVRSSRSLPVQALAGVWITALAAHSLPADAD